MEYIRDCDIKALKKYKYNSVDKSLIEKYILNPYWCWLVTKVPLWVAPNLITLTGFLFMVVSVGLLLTYGSNWEEVPSWVYFCWGAFLFIYQSLDAIDGKQARRTGSSGPLGELFDHGCDAINTTLAIICALSALGVGASYVSVVAICLALANFYVSSWETYHTHTLFLSYISGPVEGILSGCIMFCITGLKGTSFWKQTVNQLIGTSNPNLEFPILYVVAIAALLMVVFNLVYSSINVYNYTKNTNEGLGKKLLGLLPQVFLTGIILLWTKSSTTLVQYNLIPFFLFIGFGFGHQVGLIILNHVSKRSFPYWNRMYTLIVSAAMVSMSLTTDFVGLAQKYGITLFDKIIKIQNYRDAIIDLLKGEGLNVALFERYAMWALFAVSFVMYMEFALYVINRLCGIFDINCLSIKHPRSNMMNSSISEKVTYTVGAEGKKLLTPESPLVNRRRNRMQANMA